MDDQAESGTDNSNDSGPETPPPAPEVTPPAPGTIVGDGVALVEGEAPAKAEFSPPRIEAETGIALEGDYPVNHRLRAERLAREGRDEDPDGLITPELIKDTAERLAGEDRAEEERLAAEEKANPPVRANMRTAELEKIAADQEIDISSAANNEQRVELIEAARAAGLAKPANEGGR